MAGLTPQDREVHILEALTRDGTVSATRLAEELGVSTVTIRHQLRDLETRGLLSRTHGGAQSTSARDVLGRERVREAEKERIAHAAASLVRDGDSIMIEAGTTTSRIVRHLASLRGVQIVTNSTLVFAHARHNTALTVILTGGVFHRPSESLVGPVALRSIRDFHVRLAFTGTDGCTVKHGLTTQFGEGAEVIAAMHAQADETWLVADSSKFGRAGFVRVLDVADLAGVITDDQLGGPARRELTEAGPQLRVV